jgi:hypothetical protein
MTKHVPSDPQKRKETAFCKFPVLENPFSEELRPARLERATYGSLARDISSDRTTNLLPLSRCASTIHSVRPSESMAETQPKLQPDALSVSAISSQYLI